MGPQQVLRAAAAVAALCAASVASATPQLPTTHLREKVAVVDLGPAAQGDGPRKALLQAVVTAGLEPVVGDGVDDALAGATLDPDAIALTSAMQRAQQAFGALDCKAAREASVEAIHMGAARQAADAKVPELSKAYAYILLCADRTKDTDAAMAAAAKLRVVGAPDDVMALLDKYPEIDSVADREIVTVEITADVPGADVWVDHVRVGRAPVKLQLVAGEHLIAAAKGTRRGWASGTAVKSQPAVQIATTEQGGRWTPLSNRITSWHGAVPPPDEIAAVMTEVSARIVVIRRGEVIEAWGRLSSKDTAHRLGKEEGVVKLADADKLMALIVDRAHSWNDHAPDPDQPLLTESVEERLRRKAAESGGPRDEPTKWWVYASIFGAVAAGALVIYAHDASSDSQHVELHVP